MNGLKWLFGRGVPALAAVDANGGGPAEVAPAARTLFGGYELPPFAVDSITLARLREIRQERSRLGQAQAEQRAAAVRLREEIAELDKARVEQIADAIEAGATQADWEAVASPNASAAALKSAPDPLRRARESLLAIELKRQALADAERLGEIFVQRAAAFDEELKAISLQASVETGSLLDGMFKAIAERYNASARETADLAMQLSAVQDAMMILRTGNSNGWDRRAYLPYVVHDSRHPLPPLIDCGAGDLKERIKPYVEQVLASLEAAGYNRAYFR